MSVFDAFKTQFADFISRCQGLESKVKQLEDEIRKLKSENEKLRSLKDKKEVEEILEQEEENCSICIDSFENKFKLPCGHEFCLECIHSWAVSNRQTLPQPRCPVCRATFHMHIFNRSSPVGSNEIRCECGKLNPNRTHYSTVQHNKYLFIYRYRRVIENFLENEFERLFRRELDRVLYDVRGWQTRIFNEETSNNNTVSRRLYETIVNKTCDRMSYYVIRKVGSNSNRMKVKAAEWVESYLVSNYEILNIVQSNESEVLTR